MQGGKEKMGLDSVKEKMGNIVKYFKGYLNLEKVEKKLHKYFDKKLGLNCKYLYGEDLGELKISSSITIFDVEFCMVIYFHEPGFARYSFLFESDFYYNADFYKAINDFNHALDGYMSIYYDQEYDVLAIDRFVNIIHRKDVKKITEEIMTTLVRDEVEIALKELMKFAKPEE